MRKTCSICHGEGYVGWWECDAHSWAPATCPCGRYQEVTCGECNGTGYVPGDWDEGFEGGTGGSKVPAKPKPPARQGGAARKLATSGRDSGGG